MDIRCYINNGYIITTACGLQPHQRGRTWLLQPVQSWSMTAFPVRGNASESSTETADLGEMETEEKVEPYELVKDDILALSDNIKKVLLSYTVLPWDSLRLYHYNNI